MSVAGQPDIKTGGSQRFHLPAEDRCVGRRLREQVVGMDKRPALGLAEPVDLNAGEIGVAALPGR